MSLATDLIAVAQSLLNEFGQNVTFTNNNVDSYDPTTGIKTITPTNYSGDVYVSKFNNREIGSPLGSTVIKADDLKIIASDMTRVPEEGDTVSISSVDYRVMQVAVTNVSAVDVLYNIVARK